MTTDDFAAVSVIRFSDGGPPSAQLLHRGSKESCIETANFISALSYSGDRPVKDASVIWIPGEQWDAAVEAVSAPSHRTGGEQP